MLNERLAQATPEDRPGLENLIEERDAGRLIECLSDGFVRIVDVMGGDDAVVQAARVSYGAGTKKVSDDRNLIRYLMRNAHTSPFEMVEFKFHIRCPMDCWRQWIRHRTANVNEYSTRYSEAIDSMDRTTHWRSQSGSNKQGSAGLVDKVDGLILGEAHNHTELFEPDGPLLHNEPTPGKVWGYAEGIHSDLQSWLTATEQQFHDRARALYEARLRCGVAREQARKDLPLSNYTEAYWKIDLHNLFHFLRLRIDPHAQKEIRDFGQAMYKLIEPHAPLCVEAFQDYRVKSMQLTGPEIEIIQALLAPADPDQDAVDTVPHQLSSREVAEFNQKVRRIGLRITARDNYAELD